MKHLKMLGLALVAAAAFMAFASSASAQPTLTSPANVDYTGNITATAEGTHLVQAGFANITCTTSTIAFTVTTNNTTKASGSITTYDTSGCNATVITLKNGSVEITPNSPTGSNKGTVKGSGSEVTVSTLGVSCVYGTGAGTTLGTVTGGNPATIAVSASLPKISGGFLCASPASWTTTYTVTSPKPLIID
ncbi:MAG TPA: hypothetical protein VD761_05455 [Solirubrobacterales bacterium]|nr:hypothetical protein [Solirubrobacterales bacterium]